MFNKVTFKFKLFAVLCCISCFWFQFHISVLSVHQINKSEEHLVFVSPCHIVVLLTLVFLRAAEGQTYFIPFLQENCSVSGQGIIGGQ